MFVKLFCRKKKVRSQNASLLKTDVGRERVSSAKKVCPLCYDSIKREQKKRCADYQGVSLTITATNTRFLLHDKRPPPTRAKCKSAFRRLRNSGVKRV